MKAPSPTPAEERRSIVIRFAGDSGDGMQITGSQFTATTALLGHDVATLPDFPAEIRAPRGTTYGVSGFQVQFASSDIYTPGDTVNALVEQALRNLAGRRQAFAASGKTGRNGDELS